MSRVSIIIPVYNTSPCYIQEAIDSVLAQTYTNIEVVVVNDGSTNLETVSFLSRISHPNICIIHQENKGLAGARNIGIQHAHGDYILPLDSDDMIAPDYIHLAVEIMERSPEIGIVYSNANLFGSETGRWNLQEYKWPNILSGNVIFCSALFRKSDWALVGGYNVNMIFGYEDWDFWLSLIERGRSVYKLEDVLFFYRKSDSTPTLTDKLVGSCERHKVTIHTLIGNHLATYLNYPNQLSALLDMTGEVAHRVRQTERRLRRYRRCCIVSVMFAMIFFLLWLNSMFSALW